MDPISALSLAANIFQVIGFGLDVISVASKIHQLGSNAQIDDLLRSGKVLDATANLIETERPRLEHPDDQDEAFLRNVTSGLRASREIGGLVNKIQLATEKSKRLPPIRTQTGLVGKLQNVAPKPTKPSKRITDSIWEAFQTIWNKDKIDALRIQLSEERANLQLYASVSIKAKLDKQAIRIDDIVAQLEGQSRTLLVEFTSSFDGLKAQSDSILQHQVQSERLAAARHQEILDAFRSYGTGVPLSVSNRPSLDHNQVKRIRQTVLSSLWYPPMRDREDDVQKAYKSTLTWIHSTPDDGIESQWDDFGEFLKSGVGTYWVAGKAGSGKSTLMKLMFQHQRTKELLRVWTGDEEEETKVEERNMKAREEDAARKKSRDVYDLDTNEADTPLREERWKDRLVMANFFFYYKGSALQKSEAGVFRSLLYQILAANPDLIELAFPERYSALSLSGNATTFEPSVQELKRALTNTIQTRRLTPDSPIFFFAIDGLDEYDSNYSGIEELAKYFKDLGSFSNVKLVLSSRPEMVFVHVFSGCPSLHLHDLTGQDILNFVNDDLKTEIVEASSGVFLWVHLVVRSLLQSLLSGFDNIDDLRSRVQELPTDLKPLFRHMWDRIPIEGRYREQASRLLQLAETGTALGKHLSLVGVSFAQSCNLQNAIEAELQPMKDEEAEFQMERTRAQILSSCMGLVEIRKRTTYEAPKNVEGDPYPNLPERKQKHPHVAFIHRSVYEFISAGDVRLELLKASSPTVDQSPESSLLASALLRLKTTGPFFPEWLDILALNCLFRSRQLEKAAGVSPSDAINELNRVMSRRLNTFFGMPASLAERRPPLHWSQVATVYRDRKGQIVQQLVSTDPALDCKDDLLSLAVQSGLELFVQEAITRGPPSPKPGKPLLAYALGPNTILAQFTGQLPLQLSMVDLLLKHGQDPNQVWGSQSVWATFLCNLFTNTASTDGAVKLSSVRWEHLEILKLMILRGAHPAVTFQTSARNQDDNNLASQSRLGLKEACQLLVEGRCFFKGEEFKARALSLEIISLVTEREPRIKQEPAEPKQVDQPVTNSEISQSLGRDKCHKKSEWLRLSNLKGAIKKALEPDPSYPNPPGNLEVEPAPDFIRDIKALGFKDYRTLLAFLNTAFTGTVDDNELLLENIVQLLAKLPPTESVTPSIRLLFPSARPSGTVHAHHAASNGLPDLAGAFVKMAGGHLDKAVFENMLMTLAVDVAYQTMLLYQVLDYYLGDGKKHLHELRRLARESSKEADEVLVRYILEGSRLRSISVVIRDVTSNQTVAAENPQLGVVKLEASSRVTIDPTTASHGPASFDIPEQLKLSR
ncbi:hypothetical protein QBC43DRAFT_288685 [Cladorrhinum sp. PSN259]|nr:hypothetical protein QBC43DRAFT_288685 [Cladorrhinum sp. PSN259]